jgi:ATP-dependent RNA helicase RhlE
VSTTTFAELGLAESLLRALRAENYIEPTPIQARAIPVLLAGKDILGIAQTGTGKTAAFSLPLLQRLAEPRVQATSRAPRSLILAPTRELAIQIGEDIKRYGRNIGLRSAVIFGGVGYKPQTDALNRGLDILIATPGRLIDHIGQGNVKLDRVSFFVLDEADRMLDMGFIRDVRRIAALLPKERQSLLFSATMPPEIGKLAAALLRAPERVEVTPVKVTVDLIDQRVYHVPTANKRELLNGLLRDPSLSRILVFTRTKRGANRVAEQLGKAGVRADAIHGNKSQNARQKALQAFRAGQLRVLVATDVASRGIDIDEVSHVINYDMPEVPESYVHRIGRTGRAGARGIALSFCDPSERGSLRDIERLTRRTIAVVDSRGAPRVAAAA